MLISRNLHNKSSEVSIKTRSTPASLSFNGQATKHTTVKWSIAIVRKPFEVLLKLTSLNPSLRRPSYFVRVANFVESLGIE